MRVFAGSLTFGVLLACTQGGAVVSSSSSTSSSSSSSGSTYVPEPAGTSSSSSSSSSGYVAPLPPPPCAFSNVTAAYADPKAVVVTAYLATCKDGGVNALVTGAKAPARVVSSYSDIPRSSMLAVQTYDAAAGADPGVVFDKVPTTHAVYLGLPEQLVVIGKKSSIEDGWDEAVLSPDGAKVTALDSKPALEGDSFGPDDAKSAAKGDFLFANYKEAFASNSEALIGSRAADGTWSYTVTPLTGSLGGILTTTPSGGAAIAYSVSHDQNVDIHAVAPGGAPVKIYASPDKIGVSSAVFDNEALNAGAFASASRLIVASGGVPTITELDKVTTPCTYPAGGAANICGSTCTEKGIGAQTPKLVADAKGAVFAFWLSQTYSNTKVSTYDCAVGPIGCGCYPRQQTVTPGPLVLHVSKRAGTTFTESWSHELEEIAYAADRTDVTSFEVGLAEGKLHFFVHGPKSAWLVLDPDHL